MVGLRERMHRAKQLSVLENRCSSCLIHLLGSLFWFNCHACKLQKEATSVSWQGFSFDLCAPLGFFFLFYTDEIRSESLISCPMSLRLVACHLLLEISALIRSATINNQYQPVSRGSQEHYQHSTQARGEGNGRRLATVSSEHRSEHSTSSSSNNEFAPSLGPKVNLAPPSPSPGSATMLGPTISVVAASVSSEWLFPLCASSLAFTYQYVIVPEVLEAPRHFLLVLYCF